MKHLYIAFSLIICSSSLILSSDQRNKIVTKGTFFKKVRIDLLCPHPFVNFNQKNEVNLQKPKNNETVPLAEYNELIDLFSQAKTKYEMDREAFQKRITDLENELKISKQTIQANQSKQTIQETKKDNSLISQYLSLFYLAEKFNELSNQ